MLVSEEDQVFSESEVRCHFFLDRLEFIHLTVTSHLHYVLLIFHEELRPRLQLILQLSWLGQLYHQLNQCYSC